MNRFEQTRTPLSQVTEFIYPLVGFIALLLLFLGGIHSVNETSLAKQQESLETAVHRNIAQCYAVEGAYPPSIEYLHTYYGLTYNTEEFLVDYKYYGGNLLPEVTVLRKQH